MNPKDFRKKRSLVRDNAAYIHSIYKNKNSFLPIGPSIVYLAILFNQSPYSIHSYSTNVIHHIKVSSGAAA